MGAPRDSLRGHDAALYTTHLFHPPGTSLALDTHRVLPALVSAPLQWLLGLVPAYNLMILLSYVRSGLATYLLAVACLILFASRFLGDVVQLVAERARRALALAAVVALCCALFVHIPFAVFPSERGFWEMTRRIERIRPEWRTGEFGPPALREAPPPVQRSP